MSDVIDFLEARLTRGEADGRWWGAKWATEKAEPAQLARLAAARDPVNGGWNFGSDPAAAFGPEEQFFFVIEPEDKSRAAAAEFWERLSVCPTPAATLAGFMLRSAFIDGFALGATDVWDATGHCKTGIAAARCRRATTNQVSTGALVVIDDVQRDGE